MAQHVDVLPAAEVEKLRAFVQREGEQRAADALQLSAQTLARALASLPIARSTLTNPSAPAAGGLGVAVSFDETLSALVREAVRAELAVLPKAPETRPTLLDRKGLARELAVSVASIDRLAREGLPFVRVGAVKRFDLKLIRAWLDSQK